MANKTVQSRAEVPVQYTWDMRAIYPSDAEWEADFVAVPPMLDELEKYQGRLAADAPTLLAAMNLSNEIRRKLSKLAVYAFLRRDEDTTHATYQALADRAQQLGVRAGAAGSFMRPELLSLPDGTIERFMSEEPGLRVYEHVFDDMLREKPHVLSETEENLLAQAGELASAPGTIFTMLEDADLKFSTIVDEEGEEVELTNGRYLRYIYSPVRRVRADAFNKLHGAYEGMRNTCAATFSSNVKADLFYARTRKYPSALEAALHPDNIPVAVYNNLIEGVHEKLPLLHRYFKLRQRALGLDELHMYDLHVPLVLETGEGMPYDQAADTVLSAFEPLGPEYVAGVKEGYGDRWIDVYETPNKRSGAYSWGAYDTKPYILMNYQDTLRDMFTLAHELGHTMHSYFTRRTQPFIYGDYTIFVAEVASTLNEALLTDYLLKNTDHPDTRLAIVNNNLDNFRGTLYRQAMFAEFEKITHEAAEAGEALTADSLSAMYYDLNKLYHGPGVVADEIIKIEWARIPHFYSSFYVFQYATGISAATALSQQIINEGKPAVDRYLRFLSSGSSHYSIDLLRDAGVDMTSPTPVEQALQVFSDLLDEMERLLIQTGRLTPEGAGA
ncbi:MAG: oligoendopeptidase F [Chloroflexia bacterium]